MSTGEHIGIHTLNSERTKLLNEYLIAIQQSADDPVQVEHGNTGEACFRQFLSNFLPKKYGVTKGYIITPDLNYAGPLEEWDIIIFDALESPVLSIRKNGDENENAAKRGIPVEYVRGVIEVKATFNPISAKNASSKLMKLRAFKKEPTKASSYHRNSLHPLFCAYSVFFKTKVNNATEYSKSLSELTTFWEKDSFLNFQGGLIISGQSCPDYSSFISPLIGGTSDMLIDSCEFSESKPSFMEDLNITVFSGGFGKNEFWKFLIKMVHDLNGENDEIKEQSLIGGYGESFKDESCVRLFPKEIN